MGKHSTWNEEDHPRAYDGKFAHSNGGPDSDDEPPRRRGMPDAAATSTVAVRDGKEIALDYHPDGSVSISTGKHSVSLTRNAVNDLKYNLSDLASEAAGAGEEAWVKSIETDAQGRPRSTFAALIRNEGPGTASLRLPPNDDPSAEELQNTTPVHLNRKDADQLDQAFTRVQAATRVDTGYGDADIHITDDNKFGIRHIGDDGYPTDVELNPRSYAKLAHAIDIVIDGGDDDDDSLADDDIVTKETVTTNAGKVTVELIGDYGGNSPTDQLRITADDDSWGLIIAGPHQQAFSDAMSKVEDAGENLEIYYPEMKRRK
ncbi:hypothetical protein [Sphaerisporangium sp. TRM90804]|uniref:hypothetical protein n=1 Tax=Sphaerisporangium sp. TRM90804 TaxID=3031113 RepID=UPI002447743F|nr:hypothetical protein [Sphaerisporangium sp. TRM90804]MDH2424749.1 hypothetical protein [Sphaerisporangium sp. TRM90804]